MAQYYPSNDYYGNSRYDTPPPPPPQHSHNAYPMYDVSQSPAHNGGYDDPHYHDEPYSTDSGYRETKRNGEYQHLPDNGYTTAPPVIYATAVQKRSCMDKMCCGCCTCFPRWLRSICCILFLIIVALGIVIGVLAALFKVPTVTFNGLQGDPTFNMTAPSTANFYFNLNITIDNQNIESLTFETIKATAFYPNFPDQAIGGGQMKDVHIPSHAVTTIIFPFALSADAKDPKVQVILHDILSKCGVYGGSTKDIKINYNVVPTIRIIGIAISPTISSSANIPCPIENLSDAGDLTSLIPSDIAAITGG